MLGVWVGVVTKDRRGSGIWRKRREAFHQLLLPVSVKRTVAQGRNNIPQLGVRTPTCRNSKELQLSKVQEIPAGEKKKSHREHNYLQS